VPTTFSRIEEIKNALISLLPEKTRFNRVASFSGRGYY